MPLFPIIVYQIRNEKLIANSERNLAYPEILCYPRSLTGKEAFLHDSCTGCRAPLPGSGARQNSFATAFCLPFPAVSNAGAESHLGTLCVSGVFPGHISFRTHLSSLSLNVPFCKVIILIVQLYLVSTVNFCRIFYLDYFPISKSSMLTF